MRKLFAGTDEAKRRKWTVSRFSYNVKQGQCPTCGGAGKIEVELVFLPGSYTTCPDCHGARYNDETLEVAWEGLNIAQVLDLTVDEAADVFADEPGIPQELCDLDTVVITPHVASATHETRRAMADVVLANIDAHRAGQELPTRVN